MDSPDRPAGPSPQPQTVRDRWLSALAYVGPLCLLPMLASPKDLSLIHISEPTRPY